MRRNQISLTVMQFGEDVRMEHDGIPPMIHVYTDSNNFWEALGLAFSAVTARLCGGHEELEPSFGRCDVATSKDTDENKQGYLRSLLKIRERYDPYWKKHETSTGFSVKVSVQRFLEAVPENYPKNEQDISVSCFGDDVFKTMADAQTAVIDKVRLFEPVAVPSENLVVRTNIDEVDPLVGTSEQIAQQAEHNEAQSEEGQEA